MVPLQQPRNNGTLKTNIGIMGKNMRWAVEYKLPSGSFGVYLFIAEDEQAAQEYVHAMRMYWGHTNVFNLTHLAAGTTVLDLYTLFPPRLRSTDEKRG